MTTERKKSSLKLNFWNGVMDISYTDENYSGKNIYLVDENSYRKPWWDNARCIANFQTQMTKLFNLVVNTNEGKINKLFEI